MNQLSCVLLSTSGALTCEFSGLPKLNSSAVKQLGDLLATRAKVLGGPTWAKTLHRALSAEGPRLCDYQLSPPGLWAAMDNRLKRRGCQLLVVDCSVCLLLGSWTARDGPGGMWRRRPCWRRGGRERTLGHEQGPSRPPSAAGALFVEATFSLVALLA